MEGGVVSVGGVVVGGGSGLGVGLGVESSRHRLSDETVELDVIGEREVEPFQPRSKPGPSLAAIGNSIGVGPKRARASRRNI